MKPPAPLSPRRRWLHAASPFILATLGVCAGLMAAGRAGLWLVERREIAAARDEAAVLAEAAAHPGTPVVDEALPVRVVEIDLVAVSPDLELREPATIRAGKLTAAWKPDHPAHFTGLAADRFHPVSLTGPYLIESVSFQLPAGSHGARLAVRALPVEPRREPSWPAGGAPEKVMVIELTGTGAPTVRWRVGSTVISEFDCGRLRQSLADHIEFEWQVNRSHFDPSDRKFDQAIVRVAPTSSFPEVAPVVLAVLATKRRQNVGGDLRTVPAFVLSVQP